MLKPQSNVGNAGLLNQVLDFTIVLFRRAACNRDRYDDFALWGSGFIVHGGEANAFNDASIRKPLNCPANFGGFRLKSSHRPHLSSLSGPYSYHMRRLEPEERFKPNRNIYHAVVTDRKRSFSRTLWRPVQNIARRPFEQGVNFGRPF